MGSHILTALAVIGAYLIGAIPFGFLIGKMRGVDVRTVGSKNIGATNVFRTVGKKWGLIAFACDFLKGYLPTLVCTVLVARSQACAAQAAEGASPSCALPLWLPLAVGVACVIGHMLTPYMKFKGGKGVATAFGMLVALVPGLVGIAFLVFAVFFGFSHFISLGSCAAAAFLAVGVWVQEYVLFGTGRLAMCILITFIAIFVIWKHRSNIKRLVKGEENKIYLFGKPTA